VQLTVRIPLARVLSICRIDEISWLDVAPMEANPASTLFKVAQTSSTLLRKVSVTGNDTSKLLYSSISNTQVIIQDTIGGIQCNCNVQLTEQRSDDGISANCVYFNRKLS
jgi:hypothetical protein